MKIGLERKCERAVSEMWQLHFHNILTDGCSSDEDAFGETSAEDVFQSMKGSDLIGTNGAAAVSLSASTQHGGGGGQRAPLNRSWSLKHRLQSLLYLLYVL